MLPFVLDMVEPSGVENERLAATGGGDRDIESIRSTAKRDLLVAGGVPRQRCGNVPRYWRSKQIASTRDGPDDAGRIVGQSCPDIPDALDEGIVGHGHTGPDGLDQLFLGDEAAGVLSQIAQGVE